MKRIADYLASLKTIVQQNRVKAVVAALAAGAEFSQLIKPLGQRVLILSPHPGDEVMAIGGTMAWYAKNDISMTVITMTAGCRGTNTGKLSKKLGPKRAKEQQAAFGQLGEEIKTVAWGLDEGFVSDEQLVFTLTDCIDELNPDIIYIPSLMDANADSQTANRLLASALQRLPVTRLRQLWMAQYELWTPIVPNKILSIDEYQEVKKKAIECHESQLLCRDYLNAMIGLNRYRAAMLGAGTHAEAYFMSLAPQYLALSESSSTPVLEMVG